MTKRILLLRPGGAELPPEAMREGVDILTTHEISPVPDGIAEAIAFKAAGARLVVSSATTVRMLVGAGAGELFRRPFAEQLAAGEETARTMRAAGSPAVRVPETPGAAGILSLLPDWLSGERILWPRGSDADREPLRYLESRGARVTAPVVYAKLVVSSLDTAPVETLLHGGYDAVAVTSLAALDVLFHELKRRGADLPQVRWGVLGPETARAFQARGLPKPAVPERPKLSDLITLLLEP